MRRLIKGSGWPPAVLAAALIGPPLFGLVALALGQDANWDLRNYHFYNPYALLRGRLGFDIVPAHPATFYNPLLHLPFYWAAEALPARWVGFLLGAVQGANLALLVAIALRLLVIPPGWRRAAAAFALGALAMTGAGFIGELGTSFADNVLSLLFLTALLVLISGHALLAQGPLARAALRAALAGLVIGLAVGLKPTMAIYGIGLAVACFAVVRPSARGLALGAGFALGGLCGLAVVGGHWMWTLWQAYGNPIFPHLNGLFQSPLALPESYRDTRFIPTSIAEALLFPLFFAVDSHAVGEATFRDLRVPLAFAAALLALAAASAGQRPRLALTAAGPGRLLLAAAAGTYVPWVAMFAIYRYAIGLELIAPLVIVAALDRLPMGRRWRYGMMAACAAAILALLRPGDWGHVPWPADGVYVRAVPPPGVAPSDSLVLMAGFEPLAYVIPRFDPAIRFVRIHGYFTAPTDSQNRHNALIRGITENHRGPVLLLTHAHELPTGEAAARHFGLAIAARPCPAVANNFNDYLLLCRLQPGVAPG